MSRAEEFIQEHISNCYNYNSYAQDPIPWLTPDDARKALKIAREEIYEWLSYHLDTSKMDVDYKFEVIEELRKAMKDE